MFFIVTQLIKYLFLTIKDFENMKILNSQVSMQITLNTIIISLLVFSATSMTISPLCSACHQVVQIFQKSIPLRPMTEIGNQIGTKYCQYKHLQQNNVCRGAVTQMTQFILNSLWRHYTDPHLVCSQIKFCKKQYKIRNLTQQVKQIISSTPNKTWQRPTKRKTLKIMHISDLHPDLFYTVGAHTKCSEPVCCRGNVSSFNMSFQKRLQEYQSGKILTAQHTQNQLNGNGSAGYWGSIAKCDLPFQTFDLFLKDLSKLKLDLIIWTGDNTPHDVWQQTQDYNLNYTFTLVQRLKKATNATIIPTFGNHESWPVNVYDYEGDRQKVLVGGLANAFRQWLDDKAYNQLRQNGYYSIQLPHLNNLKVISVNTQADNDLNWFLLRDPTDPGNMLKWIEKQLKMSQQKNQFVYIIGHIPPRGLYDWSVRFNALVQRYSYIIRGQFYGHSHSDHIGFFPSFKDNKTLTGYYLLPPSITTYSDKNTNYRIMSIDYDTLQVLDYDQYMLDLRKYQTKDQDAKYQLYYSFKNIYKLDDMTLTGGITDLYHRMEKDPSVQKLYTKLMSGGLDPQESGRYVFCNTLTSPEFQANCMGQKYKKSQFQQAAGPWKTLTHK